MSIPSWARKGALVVCVDDTPPDRTFDPFKLRRDHIYTVDGPADHVAADGTLGIKIAGEPNRVLLGTQLVDIDCGWRVTRFRPLVDDANDAETEREIYRRKVHQNGAPVKALERT